MFPIRKSSSDLLIPNTQVRIMAVLGGLDEQEMQIASKRVVLFLKENLEPLNNSKKCHSGDCVQGVTSRMGVVSVPYRSLK